MKLFKYWDYSKGSDNKRLVFEVEASGIVKADELYEQEFGKHPAKIAGLQTSIHERKII